jgi:signal transduction histidine kinase
VLVVSGILTAMAFAVYGWELHASDQQVNDQLTQWVAHAMPGGGVASADGQPGQVGQPDPRDPLDHDHYEPFSPNVFSVTLDQQGRVIADPANVAALGLPDLAAAAPVLSGKQTSTLVTTGRDDHTFRLYTVPIYQHGAVVGALQAGMSLAPRERQLHDLLAILAAVSAGMLLLTGLASLFLADRALFPMRLAYDRQRQFAAAASHELRTPLALARSQAELVERSLGRALAAGANEGASVAVGSDDLRRMRADVGEITAEVDYMTRLVRDLLLLARDAGDHQGALWESVDLRGLVAETAAKLQLRAIANGLTLRMDTPPEGETGAAVYVRGDGDRLRQLALALLENAIHYTPAGGTITARVGVVHGHGLPGKRQNVAQLVVADTGVGIAPEDMPRIFEPFYRADAARGRMAGAENHSGAGLGLALAQWIVRAHEGEIAARSTPGKGATFTVTLPEEGGH